MDSINKTLYITLYGKSYVSKKGIILKDFKAEEICEKGQIKIKAKSKWLAYYMGMRSAVFDKWVSKQLSLYPNATVLHLGCGLDSRVLRVGNFKTAWYDIDFNSVILERKKHYTETEFYRMLSADIRDASFVDELPKTDTAIVILEGVSMYLTNDELITALKKITSHFKRVSLLVDCYTPFAVKMSKIKNPVKSVGVNTVYGIDSPSVLENGTGLTFIAEREITPNCLIEQLKGVEYFIFKNLYAGKTSKKLYKLYEYKNEHFE